MNTLANFYFVSTTTPQLRSGEWAFLWTNPLNNSVLGDIVPILGLKPEWVIENPMPHHKIGVGVRAKLLSMELAIPVSIDHFHRHCDVYRWIKKGQMSLATHIYELSDFTEFPELSNQLDEYNLIEDGLT